MYFFVFGWSWLVDVMVGGFNDSEKSGKQMLMMRIVNLEKERFIEQNHKYLIEWASRKSK